MQGHVRHNWSMVGAFGAALFWGTVALAEPPFGHADWKASPTDPVGFAGQGNNWYPGATPPLEWSDTTNGPAKNILWKVPHPGWTDAQPIVVPSTSLRAGGNPSAGSGQGRVIGLYSPHHIVCYDADTGKVLWQDELKLVSLPVLQADGKTVLPVLDPARAQKQQLLFERAMAQARIHQATRLTYTYANTLSSWAERRALIEYVADTMETWRPDLERDFPNVVPALDRDLELYRMVLAGKTAEFEKISNGLRQTMNHFVAAVQKELPQVMTISVGWPGGISDVMAAPVSDGEVVCVTMGYGQLAAYEVATGKRLWAWRHPAMCPAGVNHCASPLLWKDLFLVPAPSLPGGQAQSREWNRQSLLAIDKRTGTVRWETPDLVTDGANTGWGKRIGFHGTHESPHLMRYPLGNGQVRALVLGNTGHILDAETGASLGQLRGHVADGSTPSLGALAKGFTATFGDWVYRGSAADNFSPPLYITQLKLSSSNTVEQIPGPVTQIKFGGKPFALSDRLLAQSSLADPRTGAKLADLERSSSVIIAGRHVLSAAFPEHKKQEGSDLLALTVRVYEPTDPAKPKLVATNVIQARGYTPDISGKYFPRYASEPALRRWGTLGTDSSTYQGIGFYYGVRTAGLTAHGNRLYLHSPSWLYCIGEN